MTINPFTLKELRQLTRAKSISGALVAFLFIALVIAYCACVAGIDQTTGASLFGLVNGTLLLMLCVILPANVYARLSSERGGAKARADFTLLTALPPAEIIDGKLRSAFALMVLFATATLPFGAFAYLLHGITFADMIRALAITLCWSCVLVHAALVIGSLKASRALRHTLFGLLFFGIVGSLMGVGFVASEGAKDMGLRPILLLLAATLTVCCLMRAYAIAFLSPVVMERDRALKTTTLLAILGWGGYALSYAADGPRVFEDAYSPWLGLSALGVCALAGYAMAQPVGYSRRLVAEAASRPRWRRILRWPLASGAANGFVFACLAGLLLAAFEPSIKPWLDAQYLKDFACSCGHCKPPEVTAPLGLGTALFYAFALLLVVRAVWRFLSRSTRLSPLLVPIIAAGVFVFLQSLPSLLAMDSGSRGDYRALPFNLEGLRVHPLRHLMYAGIAFAVGGLLNAVAFVRALRSSIKGVRDDTTQLAS